MRYVNSRYSTISILKKSSMFFLDDFLFWKDVKKDWKAI